MSNNDKTEAEICTSEFDKIPRPKLCGLRKNKIHKEDFEEYQETARNVVNTLAHNYKSLKTSKEKADEERVQLYEYAKKAEAHIKNLHSQFDQYCNEHSIIPFSLKDAKHTTGYLIQKNELVITENIKNSFLAKLESIGIVPDKDQKKMLFSRTPGCCITAGAGAGKSTTLAARVALLHIELGIPLHKITVCTFTCASRADFIEKVVDIINKLRSVTYKPLTVKDGQALVKTFHSIALKMYQSFGKYNRKLIFGDYTPKIVDEYGNTLDVDHLNELSEKELKKLYKKDENIPPLSEVLSVTYKKLFTRNTEFKSMICSLHAASLTQRSSGKNFFYDNPKEDSLSKKLLSDWIDENKDFYSTHLKDYMADDSRVEKIKTCTLNSHFYFPTTGIKLFVSLIDEVYKNDSSPDRKGEPKSIANWLFFRRRVVNTQASDKYIWTNDLSTISHLLMKERIANGEQMEREQDHLPPPDFAYSAKGEKAILDPTSTSYIPIQKQLYDLATFAYSNGRKLSKCTEKDINTHFEETSNNDQIFVEAAILFERQLDTELAHRNLVTFDQILYELSEVELPSNKDMILNHLGWIKNLLIDEFQDISPNIINVICNLKRKYFQLSDQGTMMIIGDENQSLYSWRGSSKEYISNPNKYFSAIPPFTKIPLPNNYRSSVEIVRRGRQCLESRGYSSKLYPARSDAKEMDTSFNVFQAINSDNEISSIDYSAALEKLKWAIEQEDIKPTAQNPIFILSSKKRLIYGPENSEWNNYVKRHLKLGVIQTHTIHTSKGLEADCVFLMGDIINSDPNPIKNSIYRWCDIGGGTYDDAQYHEALCKLYVAITRAKKHFSWFLSNNEGSSLYKEIFLKEFG